MPRHLDGTPSTDDIPAHSFDRIEKLSPGETLGEPAPSSFEAGRAVAVEGEGRRSLGRERAAGVRQGYARAPGQSAGSPSVRSASPQSPHLAPAGAR